MQRKPLPLKTAILVAVEVISLIRIITIILLFVNDFSEFQNNISGKEEIPMNQILERMEKLGLKQVDLIVELRKRGLTVQPPEMSNILRGINTYPKAKRVLSECEKVIAEHESCP